MAGPLEELVKRIERRVERFEEDHGVTDAEVTIELVDGAMHRVRTISAEPGFGFVSFAPHGEDDDPQEIIVPLGAVRQVRIGAPGPEHAFGFAAVAPSRQPWFVSVLYGTFDAPTLPITPLFESFAASQHCE